MKEINVGLVGYKFMGKAHSNAFKRVGMFFDCPVQINMRAICGRDEAGVSKAARKFGWDSYETSWEKLVTRDDIGLVDITAPSDAHKVIALAAAENGKNIFCEKKIC